MVAATVYKFELLNGEHIGPDFSHRVPHVVEGRTDPKTGGPLTVMILDEYKWRTGDVLEVPGPAAAGLSPAEALLARRQALTISKQVNKFRQVSPTTPTTKIVRRAEEQLPDLSFEQVPPADDFERVGDATANPQPRQPAANPPPQKNGGLDPDLAATFRGMDFNQLKSHAAANGINLGNAKTKDEAYKAVERHHAGSK